MNCARTVSQEQPHSTALPKHVFVVVVVVGGRGGGGGLLKRVNNCFKFR